MLESKELESEVAKELGISEEVVKLVVSNFWNEIRWYMSNPSKAKKGIHIAEFFKFRFREKHIRSLRDFYREKVTREMRYPQYTMDILNELEGVIKNIEFYDKQENC